MVNPVEDAALLRICPNPGSSEVDNAFLENYPDKTGRQHSLGMVQSLHEYCPMKRQAWGELSWRE